MHLKDYFSKVIKMTAKFIIFTYIYHILSNTTGNDLKESKKRN